MARAHRAALLAVLLLSGPHGTVAAQSAASSPALRATPAAAAPRASQPAAALQRHAQVRCAALLMLAATITRDPAKRDDTAEGGATYRSWVMEADMAGGLTEDAARDKVNQEIFAQFDYLAVGIAAGSRAEMARKIMAARRAETVQCAETGKREALRRQGGNAAR